MDSRELCDYKGRKLIGTSGPVSTLGLEGLVIPLMPDLGVSIFDPFIGRMIKEAQVLGEDILNLPDTHAGVFRKKYGIIEEGGVPPFQVPPRSAHLINGHGRILARNLIYACAIDARDGKPYFDLALLSETVDNAITVAEQNGIHTLGIPSLMSVMFSGEYSMGEVLKTTAATVAKRLRYADLEQTSLQKVYLLSLPEGFTTRVIPAIVEKIDPSLN